LNYGQLKKVVLKLIDEYSSRGAIQAPIKTADQSFKIQDLTNDCLYELAVVVKHPGEFNVSLVDENSPLTYDLPSDWIKQNYAEFVKDNNPPKNFPAHYYRISPTKKLHLIKHLNPIDVTFYYIKRPALLVFTGDDAVDNLQELDISEDAARIAHYYVAGQVLMSEGELSKGVGLINQYESKKVNLVSSDGHYSDNITNVFGW
jgi:hypothetical protein